MDAVDWPPDGSRWTTRASAWTALPCGAGAAAPCESAPCSSGLLEQAARVRSSRTGEYWSRLWSARARSDVPCRMGILLSWGVDSSDSDEDDGRTLGAPSDALAVLEGAASPRAGAGGRRARRSAGAA